MDIIPTMFLCLATVLALVMNVFFIVVFIRRKRLRTPATLPVSMVLVHLAFVDLIATILWTLFAAITAVTDTWIISDVNSSLHKPFCDLQVYIMTFCNVITAHTLMALMFERFLWIFKPSKRQEIVFDLVVVLFLVALYIFNGSISSFVLWGFGQTDFFPDQYQCAVAYEESASHFQFTLAMHYWIPIAVIVPLYVAILIRVRILQKRRGPDGVIVLEENLKAVGDSYSDRLKEMYMKFRGAGAKSVKPKVKKTKKKTNDGFVSDDDDFNSSDEEKSKADEAVMSRDYMEKPERKRERKMYFLSRQDLREAHMYALISAVYFVLWTPYMTRNILYTYYYYDINISSEIVTTTVILTHFCSCVKVPFYLLSDRMRGAMKKTLCRGKVDDNKKRKFDAPHQEENMKREETTEL
ncbi:uncharacterized protein LOC123546879 [Mercenaria mercenaria]|uniref:uncharacterized protein LOC123546879 n=1 Tax=Mercenaria mercenaria TaxID=6596 RepID=UPI00234F0AAC|nr:uncharacterized protein LOC123546879 [Mercenaria mercenaria]